MAATRPPSSPEPASRPSWAWLVVLAVIVRSESLTLLQAVGAGIATVGVVMTGVTLFTTWGKAVSNSWLFLAYVGSGLVYGGLRLGPSDEILTSEHDHYSTYDALAAASAKSGAKVRRVRLYDGGSVLDRYRHLSE